MSRIEALRDYLFDIIEEIKKNNDFDINVDFLDSSIENYSLNRVPNDVKVNNYIDGNGGIRREIYNFLSKKPYSADVDNNLNNIGFYEEFERLIEKKDYEEILPKIKGIINIKCLDCGGVQISDTQDCIFGIQVQITYEEE